MLALANGVALGSELKSTVNECLCHLVQISEHSPRTRIIIQSFVQVLAMVNPLNNLADNLGNAIDLELS